VQLLLRLWSECEVTNYDGSLKRMKRQRARASTGKKGERFRGWMIKIVPVSDLPVPYLGVVSTILEHTIYFHV
jgi:hypothetical protein